ncbi:PREDICTED: uncharacterized protein LOC104755981 [Camelina sativa]|uniref:Uncharacterized protein LOC104755981 n=1 Tax=Camelina sativa TaxID=90675 RepID=A0ABM0WVI7_CAMSA|nr:PREDICTED: uncharacterized protein LOC104755981 [Camelina sativa]
MASSSPAKNKISVSVSSSSPSVPSRPNPKPRNSETGDLMRRSFRGNPFSTDSSRRNSLGKECSSNLVEFGDKENDKDLISSNVVVNKSLKVSKHFMSPTISAVSKINPSPRKKILSEKNEVSRSFDKTHHQMKSSSSVSFSDVISIIGDEIRIDEKEQLDVKESYDDITVTDLDENLENKSDDGSSFKISPVPPPCVPYTFPVFESYEVDPMVVAPYDPKKNYLSPRPQFLHYKPNPRIEHRFDEFKQLEELFSSSSETDLSAEDSQQEDEVDSQEVVVEAVEEEAEEILDVDGEVVEEDVVCESVEEETHQVSKQSRFKMSKLLGWIMVLGVAYVLLVSSVAFTQPSLIEGSPFYQFHIPPEIVMSASESFEQLGEKVRMCAESSLVYIDKLISSLREEEGHGGPFQFHNLTNLLEDESLSDSVFQTTGGEISVDGFLVGSQDWSLEMDMKEENVGHQEPEEEPENIGEISLEAVYEEGGNEVEQESEVNSELVNEFDEQAEIKIATDIEVNGGEIYSEPLSEEGNGRQETDVVEGQRDYEENDQKNIEEGHESETVFSQNDEKNMEESESNAHQQLDDVESGTISGHQQKETEVGNAETVSEEEGVGEVSLGVSEEATDVEHDGNEVEVESGFGEAVNDAGSEGIVLSNQKKMVVVISTVLVLLAAAAAAGFLLAKKKTKPVKMQQREDCEPTTVSATEVEHVPVENLIKERLSSLNFKEEEVGDDREREVSSLPSEMSFSFSKNKSLHSCSNNRDDLKEYQSGGGGKKSNDSGESMASSASEYSIGTVSYGSFTTYEKIQKRSGHKEKEMVTPVRRSSRIRNHQHSGQ